MYRITDLEKDLDGHNDIPLVDNNNIPIVGIKPITEDLCLLINANYKRTVKDDCTTVSELLHCINNSMLSNKVILTQDYDKVKGVLEVEGKLRFII